MTKAASFSIGLVFLLATASLSRSQPASQTQDAINEAVRRQADVIMLRQRLAQARDAEGRNDLPAAAKLYEDAYTLIKGIGTGYGIENEQAQTVQSLARVRLELARAAQKQGDLKEVKTQTDRVLLVDPGNQMAIEIKKANDKALAEMAGLRPSDAVIEQVAAERTNKVAASTLVQDAALLMEAGKLDDAEAKLREAKRIDPDSRAAFYYSSLVKERRFGEAEKRREQDSKKAIVEVAQDWQRPRNGETLPVPNPYATTNVIYTSPGRQAIVNKLDRIHLDTISYEGLGLGEVIRNLSDEAKKRDPQKKGINFIINPNGDAAAAAGPAVIDPTTGLPAAAPPAEQVDVSTIAIKINPPLTDLRLADVLDAIVKVAEKPIKYSIEDYAVVFSLRGAETPPLYFRRFKVDPNTFYQGLESVTAFAFGDIQTSSGGGGGRGGGGGASGADSTLTVPRVTVASGAAGGRGGGGGAGGGGLRFITRTNDMEGVSVAVRNFFSTLGVNLDPPKSVFWNDRGGELLVHATSQDLDIIETAVQVLNIAPHQVNVKTKFVEITQDDNKALGFDWYLGNFLLGGKSMIGSAGSQPTFQGAPSSANPEGTFPGSQFFGTAIPPAASDGLLTPGLRNDINAPAIATLTGILTDPQFRVVMRALEQRKGADLLSSPEVTTVSGRQAQVQVVDLRTIVTGTDQNSGQQQAQATVGNGTVAQAVAPVFTQPQTQILPFGPVLDVIPYISADGYTIQMTIIPTINEFVGYDDPGQFVPQAVTGGGIPIVSVLPLPHFRLRQVTTSAIVWDGQTIVLGGLISEDVTRFKDKVPLLGDLPLVGKLFRSESSSTRKKNLVIFVTPTIIDPAGNRLHNEDDMPFAQSAIPAQPRMSGNQ